MEHEFSAPLGAITRGRLVVASGAADRDDIAVTGGVSTMTIDAR